MKKVKFIDKIIDLPLLGKIQETVVEDGVYYWIHTRKGGKTPMFQYKNCEKTPSKPNHK